MPSNTVSEGRRATPGAVAPAVTPGGHGRRAVLPRAATPPLPLLVIPPRLRHQGHLVLRQAITKAVATAALAAGLDPTGLGTHGGRSTAITALYGEDGVDLADVARHVGHSNPATTATYVRHLGRRPRATAEAAGRLLDPTVARTGNPSEKRTGDSRTATGSRPVTKQKLLTELDGSEVLRVIRSLVLLAHFERRSRAMLMRTDPFRELDRVAQQVFGTAARPAAMPIDAYRKGDEFVVLFDLPGCDPASINLTVERNVLAVHAERVGPATTTSSCSSVSGRRERSAGSCSWPRRWTASRSPPTTPMGCCGCGCR